jgi:hypothetical protein
MDETDVADGWHAADHYGTVTAARKPGTPYWFNSDGDRSSMIAIDLGQGRGRNRA